MLVADVKERCNLKVERLSIWRAKSQKYQVEPQPASGFYDATSLNQRGKYLIISLSKGAQVLAPDPRAYDRVFKPCSLLFTIK